MTLSQILWLRRLAPLIPMRWRDSFLRKMYNRDLRQNDWVETIVPYLEGHMHVRSDSFIEWSVLMHGAYEAETIRAIRPYAPAGGVCLDIGANIGCYTLALAWSVGKSGQVIAFEPRPEIFERLQKNCELNQLAQARPLGCGLSSTSGPRNLFIEEAGKCNRGMSSLVPMPHHDPENALEVDIRHPQDIPELQQLKRLDFIKIDTEGHEASVLSALDSWITRFKPVILFEYHPEFWSAHSASIAQTLRSLSGKNYTLQNQWTGHPVSSENIPSATCDILALPR